MAANKNMAAGTEEPVGGWVTLVWEQPQDYQQRLQEVSGPRQEIVPQNKFPDGGSLCRALSVNVFDVFKGGAGKHTSFNTDEITI